ncbi:MAG TPA: two-component system sensor histidine kinase CreC [Opitutaceae bacterium]
MTIRTRILLVYLLIVGGGFYYLVNRSLAELRPRYLESMEESLVDTANLLANVIGVTVADGRIDAARVRDAIEGAFHRRFDARVYTLRKERVDVRVYVTDVAGRVLYDSDGGRDEGRDYSQWIDVARTLRGSYGARATRTDPADENTLVLYVAAPITTNDGERTVGVLSVGKPTASINDLVAAARRRVTLAGLAGGGLIVFVGVVFSVWIATPIARLTAYARAVRDGRPATLPRLAGREVGELRQAFEEMRAALEGKAYVERYVQALTHEIKSPLSAIRGAAELLGENPPAAEREKFLGNIRTEAGRVQRIVDQMLQLASLEARKARADMTSFDLAVVARETVDAAQATAQARGVALRIEADAAFVRGDRVLLGQAISNLLHNALEFTPAGGRIELRLATGGDAVRITIDDTGAGIPDFALPRVFERFYSLPRPGSGVKSTGLGLSLVREIAHLHEGEVFVANRRDGGVRAEVRLPAR